MENDNLFWDKLLDFAGSVSGISLLQSSVCVHLQAIVY